MSAPRVLVAEDDPGTLKILELQLAKWGFEVESAADGLQAWDRLQQVHAPRVVLLDWMMPGLDGLEVTRRLRDKEGGGQSYVLILTAKQSSDHLGSALAAGADDFIRKPYNDDELRARLGVGVRVVAMAEQLLEAERLRVLIETSGAAAHEIRQPLAIMLANSQLLGRDPDLKDPQRSKLEAIIKSIRRIDTIIEKMTTVRAYVTRAYADGRVIDLNGEGV